MAWAMQCTRRTADEMKMKRCLSPPKTLQFSPRFMNHHDFAFDDTFSETANNADVYEGTAQQLVWDALQGKQGTVMMSPGKTCCSLKVFWRVEEVDMDSRCRTRNDRVEE